MGLYILVKLSTLQNRQEYLVTAETDIDEFVRECAILHDGTNLKTYRFSRELLANVEMCVAFTPYYRQDYPRTASPIEKYYTDALAVYAAIPYKEVHEYLARRFRAWYTMFKQTSTKAVISAEDAEVGTVVDLQSAGEGAQSAKKARYSMDAVPAAAPATAPAAAAAPAAATATTNDCHQSH